MPTIHEDHGERAPRAALRRRWALWVALAFALTAPVARALSSPLCPTGTATSLLAATGTYELKIKFEGVIAFAPRGYQGGEGQPDGKYEDVVALIPRTDDEGTPVKVFGSAVPPAFYLPWQRYPLHHPVVRVRARHFAGTVTNFCQASDLGDCGDHWVYLSLAANDPLRPPSHDEEPQYAAYDVSIEACAPDELVTVTGFANVPRLLDSGGDGATAAKPCGNCLAFKSSSCTGAAGSGVDESLAARVRLHNGEMLSAHHLIAQGGKPVPFQWHAREGCDAVPDSNGLVKCNETKALDSAPFYVARHVVATRSLSRQQPVTLALRRMSDGCLVHRYLLRPPATGALEVEVLNLPADGTLDLPTPSLLARVKGLPALAHFNLFHLLAPPAASPVNALARQFYFPAAVALAIQDGRPWCSNARFDAQ